MKPKIDADTAKEMILTCLDIIATTDARQNDDDE